MATDPSSTDCRAGFIIAGVQKGGTTALFDYLVSHPSLAMAAEKEVHFFDDDTLDWSSPDYDAYHARFPALDARLRGEATPAYLYWPDSLERIAAYNPAMKLILVFRDPVERAWSHWRMERSRGFEPLSFSEAIREGRSRVSAGQNGAHRTFSYVERGFYGAQLRRLFSIFPREQVFLGASRLLRAEPALFLRNVCDFLNVAALEDVEPIRSLQGRTDGEFETLPPEDALYLRQLYADDLKDFEQMAKINL